MKKASTVWIIALVAIMAMAFASCDSPEEKAAAQAAATAAQVAAEALKASEGLAGTKWFNSTNGNSLTFNGTGSTVMLYTASGGNNTKCTYTVSGDKVEITFDNGMVNEYTLDGDFLSWVNRDGGSPSMYTKQK